MRGLQSSAEQVEQAGGGLTADAVLAGDAELARGVLGRDRKAAAEFVDRFSGPVYAYLSSRFAPRVELAEDAMQEVFMVAWERLGSWSGTVPLQAWLMGIARHKVQDHYRARLREPQCWEDLEEEPRDTGMAGLEEVLDQQRSAARAMALIGELPEASRLVLRWRYWDRLSTREIAAQTGRTEKAVERLLARAREQFRSRWLVGDGGQ